MPSGVFERKPCSEKTKKKISETKKGIMPKFLPIKKGDKRPPEFCKKISFILKNRFISDEEREIMSFNKRGDKSPNWKGGISTIKNQIYHNFKYRQWRSDVFLRDEWTCQECGIKGGFGNKIEAHHLKSLKIIISENNIKTLQEALDCEELWNINNGQTLCKDCHKKTDSYGYKK